MVSTFGLSSDEAVDGKPAIELARKRLLSKEPFYKLILMDFNMTECHGPDAAAAILKLLKEHRPEDPEVLICCVTAYETPEYMKAAFASGMKMFEKKPLSSESIEMLLKQVGLK